uniref:Uncharacterized protein n=1 Tax=Esox lucius TaxID=8010 RepID=A0A6Q2WSI1_ESOLU
MNFLDSPFSSAGPCRPARSPGRAGRRTGPGAPSYNNMCCQTVEDTLFCTGHQCLPQSSRGWQSE